jgi:murein DD-endopeptidase MepM/ murein hydrolase activator NlpD
MKTWTVMLIPHDRGSTRTLTLSNFHLWVVVGILAFLTFTTLFFVQRNFVVAQQANELRELNDRLAREKAAVLSEAAGAPKEVASATPEQALLEIEADIRARYDASLSTLAAYLTDLHEMEASFRRSAGLPSKVRSVEELLTESSRPAQESRTARGGRGGPSGASTLAGEVQDILLPPHVIYGMARPSADLIRQEMQLRMNSMGMLLQDIEANNDQVARVPANWPLFTRAGTRLSSRYGHRQDPFSRRVRHHSGLDIAAPTGTRILATARGVVKDSLYEGDYGNIVRIDHGNGYETWYAHMSERSVRKGDRVERGDLIGKVGSTGRSTGPHLHYEVHKNGRTVNPALYLE